MCVCWVQCKECRPLSHSCELKPHMVAALTVKVRAMYVYVGGCNAMHSLTIWETSPMETRRLPLADHPHLEAGHGGVSGYKDFFLWQRAMAESDLRIGFLGAGKMATALARGW